MMYPPFFYTRLTGGWVFDKDQINSKYFYYCFASYQNYVGRPPAFRREDSPRHVMLFKHLVRNFSGKVHVVEVRIELSSGPEDLHDRSIVERDVRFIVALKRVNVFPEIWVPERLVFEPRCHREQAPRLTCLVVFPTEAGIVQLLDGLAHFRKLHLENRDSFAKVRHDVPREIRREPVSVLHQPAEDVSRIELEPEDQLDHVLLGRELRWSGKLHQLVSLTSRTKAEFHWKSPLILHPHSRMGL